MNPQADIGIYLCCGITLIPAVLGGIIGAAIQRRITQMGWQKAFVPGFILRWLEDL